MDLREQRGMELAATRIIRKKKGVWFVPSQSGNDKYQVNIELATCTCLDHETRGVKCKHLYAATFVMMREQHADGSVTETVTVSETRRTYPQNWSAYNDAQTNEQDKFQVLLADLCSGLVTTPSKTGRPPLPLSDALYRFQSLFHGFAAPFCERFEGSAQARIHQQGSALQQHFQLS